MLVKRPKVEVRRWRLGEKGHLSSEGVIPKRAMTNGAIITSSMDLLKSPLFGGIVHLVSLKG